MRKIDDKKKQLKETISLLPEKPGIYQFYNSDNTIIYIGKAKNLKRRVSSYFRNRHDNKKTAMLVRSIAEIRYMVVETEQDALLLENNLVKKYKPRYNIRLKDDKSYPWIRIVNEPIPRVIKTRDLVKDGSKYFGPYTNVYMVNTLLDLFKSGYKIRTCNYRLTKKNIDSGKFRVCLEYHIGNCRGPCEGLIKEENYLKGIEEISHILKGNISGVMRHLKSIMDEKAQKLDYEEAQKIKEKYDSLKRYQSKSTVVSPEITDIDVFSIENGDKSAFINYLKIIDGAVIQTYTLEITKVIDEPIEELLMTGIIEIKQKIHNNAKEVLVPFRIGNIYKDIKFIVPKIGEKKKLLELSLRNAKYFRLDKEKQVAQKQARSTVDNLLSTIMKDLNLPVKPVMIECFDNSNFQGAEPVAACVVFKNGKPLKREYRHYNVKSVKGPDDFASMEEIVYRRYSRLINENKALPQLVVIDGGKGQLSSAVRALEQLGLRGKISIISIAKRLEEIYFPDDPVPVYINKNSETLRVIQQLRDEAHRFGITFHRKKLSKVLIDTELSHIKGIGEKTIKKLLVELKSVSNIKKAELNSLIEIVGNSKAQIIFKYFRAK
ncbi:MAG: excinuclease ABC subunit C [Bacteroidales bacterium]|nr:excinuclease ABC subunit C [Bacteroidales bacterium]